MDDPEQQHPSWWLEDVRQIALGQLPAADRDALFAAALRRYCCVLRRDPTPAPVPDLAAATYDQPLFVLIEALRAAMQATVTRPASASTETPSDGPREGASPEAERGLLDWVLDGQRITIWRKSIPASLNDDQYLPARLVTVAALAAADNEIDACERLALLPDLAADSEQAKRHQAARWLHDLYPGDGYLHPPRPDLLAGEARGPDNP